MIKEVKMKNKDFPQIDILKEHQRLRILEQEIKMKASLRELSDNLTGVKVINRLKENLFSGSGLAFKLGFMAVSILRDRMKSKRKK
jgi:hypothetical protein